MRDGALFQVHFWRCFPRGGTGKGRDFSRPRAHLNRSAAPLQKPVATGEPGLFGGGFRVVVLIDGFHHMVVPPEGGGRVREGVQVLPMGGNVLLIGAAPQYSARAASFRSRSLGLITIPASCLRCLPLSRLTSSFTTYLSQNPKYSATSLSIFPLKAWLRFPETIPVHACNFVFSYESPLM